MAMSMAYDGYTGRWLIVREETSKRWKERKTRMVKRMVFSAGQLASLVAPIFTIYSSSDTLPSIRRWRAG